ncbi:hypothetical protein F1645_12485 [Novacetimonas hansenii]
MKLFPKSFRRHRLFKKRRHPKTFPVFYQCVVFKHSPSRSGAGSALPAPDLPAMAAPYAWQ